MQSSTPYILVSPCLVHFSLVMYWYNSGIAVVCHIHTIKSYGSDLPVQAVCVLVRIHIIRMGVESHCMQALYCRLNFTVAVAGHMYAICTP